MDVSVLIPARNEQFLSRTIEDVLHNARAETEVIVICDGNWPDPPVADHPRVTLIYHHAPIGQRAATNEAARISRAKYVMKLDAHCSVGKAFDSRLMADCKPDWTMIPRMYNLHAFDWVCGRCDKSWYQANPPANGVCDVCGGPLEQKVVWQRRKNRMTEFWRFDEHLKFQYWREYRRRPEAKASICDVMSSIGACFFMERARYWEIDGLDEEHGSWGQVGTEIACKSWLSGGRHVVSKKTWFAHMFRTNHGFSFPYRLSGHQVEQARRHSRRLWRGGHWPKAMHDLQWLVDKFAPVPGWSAPKEITRGIVYYTDNHGDQQLLAACRAQIINCMGANGMNGNSLISVSQKPIEGFGENVVVDFERSVLSIFRQILIGLQHSTADIIYLLEHDLVYHPSHFEFVPPSDTLADTFWYDRNRWSVCDETGKAVFYHTNVPSMLVASRELLLRHYGRCVELTEKSGFRSRYGYSPPKGIPKEEQFGKYKTYFAQAPSLDIRRDDSWSRKRMDKSQFRSERSCRGWTEADKVPGWGRIRGRFDDFMLDVANGKFSNKQDGKMT